MKITETLQRDCCTQKDLLPVEGSPKRGSDPIWKFCKHCGKRHQIETFMDPAGSMDWEYRPQPEPWAEKGRV